MTPPTPMSPTRQQLILLLSQHKQEWRRLYGIQDIALYGSLTRGGRGLPEAIWIPASASIQPIRSPWCSFAKPFRSWSVCAWMR